MHTAASIGVALVRLHGGDHAARSDLFAARDDGLRLRLDELATVPMSHLANHEVEQGRFAQADDILADALRFSEEREIPICNMWQRGVQARLRLFQGRWREAEQDALGVLASGDIPMGRLWSHLVLGLLAARRDAPAENPHLDELWRLAAKLDLPGLLAPAAAALAEQAWIRRRPDTRLDARSWRCWSTCPPPAATSCAGGCAGSALPACSRSTPRHPPRRQTSCSSRTSGRWPCGTADPPTTCWPRSRCSTSWTPAPSRPSCAVGCASSGAGAAWPLTDHAGEPGGSPTVSSTCWLCSSKGKSNADIAARLVISRKTADHQCRRSSASSTSGRAARRWRRPGGSGCPGSRPLSGVALCRADSEDATDTIGRRGKVSGCAT